MTPKAKKNITEKISRLGSDNIKNFIIEKEKKKPKTVSKVKCRKMGILVNSTFCMIFLEESLTKVIKI